MIHCIDKISACSVWAVCNERHPPSKRRYPGLLSYVYIQVHNNTQLQQLYNWEKCVSTCWSTFTAQPKAEGMKEQIRRVNFSVF